MVGARSDQNAEPLAGESDVKMAPIFAKSYDFEGLFSQLYVGHVGARSEQVSESFSW